MQTVFIPDPQNYPSQHATQITTMIIPTSTGQVFVSEESSIRNDKPPIQKLGDDHIFVPFVKKFWHQITTPGEGELLMDAYAMLLFGIDTVPDACRQYICTQLRQTPPDIVLITDLDPSIHGFHQRTPNMLSYISIDKDLVDKWADGMARCPNDRQTLAVEALLKMTIAHEVGHWHYTLRIGPCTDKTLYLPGGGGLRQNIILFAEQEQEIIKKSTPKSRNVVWNPDKGEAGNFAEYKGLGGIMGFDLRFVTIFIRTSAGPSHLLSTGYLIAFREKGLCQFYPEKTVDLPQPLPKASSVREKVQTRLQPPTDLPFWPDTNNAPLVAPSGGLEYVDPGFTTPIAHDCPNLKEILEYRAREAGVIQQSLGSDPGDNFMLF